MIYRYVIYVSVERPLPSFLAFIEVHRDLGKISCEFVARNWWCAASLLMSDTPLALLVMDRNNNELASTEKVVFVLG